MKENLQYIIIQIMIILRFEIKIKLILCFFFINIYDMILRSYFDIKSLYRVSFYKI